MTLYRVIYLRDGREVPSVSRHTWPQVLRRVLSNRENLRYSVHADPIVRVERVR